MLLNCRGNIFKVRLIIDARTHVEFDLQRALGSEEHASGAEDQEKKFKILFPVDSTF